MFVPLLYLPHKTKCLGRLTLLDAPGRERGAYEVGELERTEVKSLVRKKRVSLTDAGAGSWWVLVIMGIS